MSFCIICFKNCDNPSQIYDKTKANVKSDIKMFFKILERYINGGKDKAGSSAKFHKEKDNVMEGGNAPCQNCYNLLEDIRDIYYVMEEAEMIFNWKMKCLAGVMEYAGDLGSGVDAPTKEVMDWRLKIAAKCNKKIQSSFPKLILKRCLLEATCSEMPQKRVAHPLLILNPNNNEGYIDTNLDNNYNLLEGIGALTEPPLNLQNPGNRQKETEEVHQTILDTNEVTARPHFTVNDENIANKAQPSVPSATNSKCNPFKITSFVKYPPNYKRDGKRWKCDKENCHFTTNNHTDYAVHQIRHAKIKNFSCKICDKKFIQKSTLNRHVRETHHRIKLFKCIYCAKPFRRASHTKIHENRCKKKKIFTKTNQASVANTLNKS